MKKHIALIFLLINSFFQAQAQIIIPELQEEFQDLLEEYKSNSNAIGLSVAFKTDVDVWASAIGQHASAEVLTTESTFGIGSVSKTITSAVILQMMEDELLGLEDSIGQYLETYPNINPNITIRQLLNHTSGIYNYTDHSNFVFDVLNFPSLIISPEEVLEKYINPAIFQPGDSWSYSNTNYVLLGMIIEAISGRAHYAEARSRFSFDVAYSSLSMPPYESDFNDMAHLWADTSDVGMPVVDMQEIGFSLNALFSSAGAAGAYVSTPSDMATWAYDLYSGTLFSEGTMNELFTITPPSTQYGLGVVLSPIPCGQNIAGHTGGIFYTTATFYDTQNEVAVSVHCNDATHPDVVGNLAAELICQYEYHLLTKTTEEISPDSFVKTFPNPFQDQCILQYELAEKTTVSIELYNETGIIINRIQSKNQAPGIYTTQIAGNQPPGLYFVKMQIGEDLITKKLFKVD